MVRSKQGVSSRLKRVLNFFPIASLTQRRGLYSAVIKMFNRRYIEKGFLILLIIGLFWILFEVLISNNYAPERDQMDMFHDVKAEIEDLQISLHKHIEESQQLLKTVREHINSEHNISLVSASKELVLPVLVMSCNRVTISRCLDKIIKYRPNAEKFPIIISQDCDHENTYKVIEKYVESDPTSVFYVKQPDSSPIAIPTGHEKFRGYYKIARHFKFALSYVLLKLAFDAVIIVEDDLDISPDFFEYFLGTYPLLEHDPTLWCISAWNDNGKVGLIDQGSPEALYRTDFFPGLGWLLRTETWLQMVERWPTAFFDDWLRNPENNGGRACIRPEISRTYSFGKVGVSRGQFFDRHLAYIVLNQQYVEFTKLDLSYLIKDEFDRKWAQIKELPVKSTSEVLSQSADTSEVQVHYSNAATFKKVAKKLGAMDDYRSGIPRTAYRGIVPLFLQNRRVYLSPSFEWREYDPSWS